jgi:flagellar basal body-associated protein FliL
MIQTVQKTIKENKMKTKCVVILAALVIALGVVMAITGCEAKKCTKAPATKAVEKAPAPKK